MIRYPFFAVALLALAGCEHLGIFEPAREVTCFQAARVSLKNAIAAVEADGGTVLDADYRQDEDLGCLRNDPGVYDVTLLAGGRIMTVSVDARTGQTGLRQDSGAMNALLGGSPFPGSPADMARAVPNLAANISKPSTGPKRRAARPWSPGSKRTMDGWAIRSRWWRTAESARPGSMPTAAAESYSAASIFVGL